MCRKNSLLAANNWNDAEQVHARPDAHVGEENLGGLAAALPGLVNLGGRHRFRETAVRGSSTITRRSSVTNRMPRTPPTSHQRAGFPVGVLEVERRPGLGDHERGNGEDGARGDRLSDGADGPRDVLLEDGASEQTQHGHADDRRRIGGGDGHSGAQAQIGVGRAEDHGHDQSEQNRAQRELAHLHAFRNVGTELFRRSCRVPLANGHDIRGSYGICLRAGNFLACRSLRRFPGTEELAREIATKHSASAVPWTYRGACDPGETTARHPAPSA